MKPENENDRRNRTEPTPPAPRRRFRLQKLEDRIAPMKGGKGTNHCGGSLVDSQSTGTSSY